MKTFFREVGAFIDAFLDAGWSGYGILADVVMPILLVLLIIMPLNPRGWISRFLGIHEGDVPSWLVWVVRMRYSFAILTVVTLYFILRNEEYGGALIVLSAGSLGSGYLYCWLDGTKWLTSDLVWRVEIWYFFATLTYGSLVLILVGLGEAANRLVYGLVFYVVPVFLLTPLVVFFLLVHYAAWKQWKKRHL